jgi:predicted metal-dependent HD superfamily phosphohydrolase
VIGECRHPPYAIAPALAELLVTHYGEPHRAYHNATHIAELLEWFDRIADNGDWQRPRDIYDAILFHDVIYDPRASDNEAKSAALARTHGASDFACTLIELTARHGKLTHHDLVGRNTGLASPRDAQYFLDADLAILGAPPARFDAYDAAIRTEYAHVPDDAFRAGRGAFLRNLHAKPRLYFSQLFHDNLDHLARANLERAIARY